MPHLSEAISALGAGPHETDTMRRIRSAVRGPAVAGFAVLGFLLSDSSAFAADYGVNVGAATDTARDAGEVACAFDDICAVRLDSLGLKINIYISRREPERASVHLYGGDVSCCYFVDAADSIAIDPRKPVSRVPFFEGVAARGGLFIQNKPAGTLYLKFNMRDRI